LFNKITIIGAGYVGFSLAVLLSQEKEVSLFDIDRLKLKHIDNKKSPLRDQNIDKFFANKTLRLKTNYDLTDAVSDSDLIILALPTNFSESIQISQLFFLQNS
jgi:UDPglucose 6-dehydrogenase